MVSHDAATRHLTLIRASASSESEAEERRRLSGVAQLLRDIYTARAGTYVQRHAARARTVSYVKSRPASLQHLRLVTDAGQAGGEKLQERNCGLRRAQ